MLRRARTSLTFELEAVKKVWNQDEDDKLKELVHLHGTKKWTLVSEGLISRTGKQCRERWCNHLVNNIKKGEWTEEEDRLIVHFQRMFGNQWAKITKMLPGRSDNAVKNRFHAFARAWKQHNKKGEENEKISYFNKLLPEDYDVAAIPCVSNLSPENETFLNETINNMALKGLDFDFDDGFGDGEDLDDEDPYQEELVTVHEVFTNEIPTANAEIPNDFDFDDGFSDVCESDDEEDDDELFFSLGLASEPKQEVTEEDSLTSALLVDPFENDEEVCDDLDVRTDISAHADVRDTSAIFEAITLCQSPRGKNYFKPTINNNAYENPALQNTYDVLLRKKRTQRTSPSGSPSTSPPPLHKINKREKSPSRSQSPPRLTHLI